MYGRNNHMNGGEGAVRRYRRDDNADPTNPSPSIVVHVRNLGPKITEADLLEALSVFGPVAYATCIPHSRMALVEFEEIASAKQCISFTSANDVCIAGQPAFFNYSTSQCIERMGFESPLPSKVLVVTVLNALYPIDADVIYKISNAHGRVLRVAVMHKPTVIQALVEFENEIVAKIAKHAMNGADIYSGCCTLKVEFAKPNHVRVNRQDHYQRDYTLPDSDAPFESARRTLLPARPDERYVRLNSPEHEGFFDLNIDYPPHDFGGPSNVYDRGGPPSRYQEDYDERAPPMGSVLMVYGIDHEKITCDVLFNILCQYGNVLKVCFMRSKAETGMIEMGTPEERNNVLDFLQGVQLFGLKLEFKPSHQDCVHYQRDPFMLPDGSPSYRDFSGSRNQRFTTPEFAAKNRIILPTNVLHWFNAPGTMDEEALKNMISEKSDHVPVKIEIFPSRNERSAAGTVEFETVEAANEVLSLVNHTPVDSPYGSAPFIVKWAYATPRRWDGTVGEPAKNEVVTADGERREGIQPAYRTSPSFRRGGGRGSDRNFRPESYRGGLHGSGADRFGPYPRGGFRGGRGRGRFNDY